MWCYRFICRKPGTLGACLGEKRLEYGRNVGRKTTEQEIISKTQNTPRLAQNAPFAHLGAPRACQSTCTSVHMAKARHSGRMFGWKTARKRPKRDRIHITATGFVLKQDPRTVYGARPTHAFDVQRSRPDLHATAV